MRLISIVPLAPPGKEAAFSADGDTIQTDISGAFIRRVILRVYR